MSDTIFINCPYCGFGMRDAIPAEKQMPPFKAAKWYERMANHIRSEHVRKRGGAG